MAKSLDQMFADLDQILQDMNQSTIGPRQINFNTPTTHDYSWTQAVGATAPPAPASGGGGDDPLWMKILNGAGALGGAVTNQIANWTDKTFDWRDIPLAESFQQFGQGIADRYQNVTSPWRDGKFDIHDINAGAGLLNIPSAIGSGLVNVGKQSKTSQDIFNNLGWQEGAADPTKGWNFFDARQGNFDIHDVASALGDIVLDPLTYITFGGASAAKAGKIATQQAAKDAAQKFGVNYSKGMNVADEVERAIRGRYQGAVDEGTIDTDLLEYIIRGTRQDIDDMVGGAGASARAGAQGAAFNIDIPFTKITKSFGGGGKAVLDRTIGESGIPALTQMFAGIGVDNASDIQRLLQDAGVLRQGQGLGDVTLQGLRFIQERLPNINVQRAEVPTNDIMERIRRQISQASNDIPTPTPPRTTPNTLPELMSPGLPQGAMPPLEDIIRQLPGEVTDVPALRGMPEVRDIPQSELVSGGRSARSARPRNVQDADAWVEEFVPRSQNAMPTASDPLTQIRSQLGQFTQDMASRPLTNRNPLNPRTFRTGDTIVDDAASTIRDKDGQIYSWRRLMDQELQGLHKRLRAVDSNPDSWKNIIYFLENDFPEGMSKSDFLKANPQAKQFEEVAEFAKGILERIGQNDLQAGTVGRLIENYFPHVFKRTDQELAALAQEYADDDEFIALLGRSSRNTAGMERKSFKSIAEAERYMAKLSRKIETATDPKQIKSLQKRLNAVSSLFETDPVKAIANRYYKSIRSRAMKELQTQFVKDGLLVKKGQELSPDMAVRTNNYVKLDKQQAGALGLSEGDKIHPEVLKGLQKTKQLFTVDGLNKFWDKVDEFQNGWKMLVTTYVPAHHVRNMLGNLANAALGGGLTLRGIRKGYTILNKMKNGTLDAADRKLLEEMADNAVINSGFVADFLEANPRGRLYNNAWAKLMRNFGEWSDNVPRIMMYTTLKDKTGSAKQAAQQVRKYLFNYHELTDADKVIRRLAPFWTWTKNNLPLQLENLAKQPRFYLTYERFKDALNGENSDDLPDWMKEGYIQVPGMNEMVNLGMPMNDLSFVDPSVGGLRNVLSMVTPFARTPIEITANKQTFSGQPISWDAINEQRDLNGSEIMEYLAKTFGGGAYRLGNMAVQGVQGNTDAMLRDLAGLLVGRPVERRE